MTADDYIGRVREEKVQLDDKIARLRAFMGSERRFSPLPLDEQLRLEEQLHHMTCYSDVLRRRLDAVDDFPTGAHR